MDFVQVFDKHGVSIAFNVIFVAVAWWGIKRLLGENGLVTVYFTNANATLADTADKNAKIVDTMHDLGESQKDHARLSASGIAAVGKLTDECCSTHQNIKGAMDSMVSCLEDMRDEMKGRGNG